VHLADRFPLGTVREALVPPGAWAPYPRLADRAGWDGLPEDRRRELVADGEPLLGTSWPELKATLFMEFHRTGNRSHYETASFNRRKMLTRLVTAECVENEGRFVDDVVNGIWAICEESFWDVAAHNRYVTGSGFGRGGALPDVANPVVALFSAETGMALAYTRYLVSDALDRVDPIISQRIQREIRTRLLDPFMARDDWWWLGFVHDEGHPGPPNNWNPWILSNLLAMALLVEDDEERRAQIVHRAIRGLETFLDGYHSDGGCDEGISYWERAGACVFDCLDTLDSATNGAIAIWDEPLIKEMGRYVYRAHIGGDWYVNFADGSARTVPDPNLVYHYGQRIGDAALAAHGAASRAEPTVTDHRFRSFGRYLNTLFRPLPEVGQVHAYPLVLQSWLDGIEVLTARETEGTDEGLFLAAKGGNNGESHNHNDVGSFIVGLDGRPLLIDVGVGEYTKKTFSPERYDIWTMQSAYHNLPTIDGHQQAPGAAFAARRANASLSDQEAALSLDIAGAWPAEAGVRRWDRSLRLVRGIEPEIVIEDDWELANPPEHLDLTLMASGDVDTATPGQIRVAGPGRDLVVTFDASAWTVSTERIPFEDSRLTPVWGNFVTRIRLGMTHPARTGTSTITARA